MVHFQQTTPPDSADMSLAQQMTSSNSSGSSTTITKKKRHTWRSVSMSSTTESVFSSKKGRKKQVVNGASNQQNSSLLPPPNVKGHQKVIKNPSRTYSVRSSALSNMSQPRTHSVRAISRAKIKTIKLTITVICCYIVCSTPFMAALLWSAFDPYAKEHPFFYGPTFTILTLLASLNSCANAFIVLFFNPNLIQSFVKGTFGRVCHHFGQHPSSLIGSQRKQVFNNRKPGTANLSQRPNTSVTGLSPLMNRSSPPKEYGNNRFNGGQDGMELIPSATEEAGNVEKVVAVVPLRSSMSSRNGNNYPRGGDSEAAPVETSFIGI
ncbi:Vasopressin V1a receptor [Folsomia candida]|uniref:Vasopressin V1a receptor n=2 Tax=Folsomia candida TaxID=158441 RepID=A0A226EYH8_FOLCA|nr:Vasopressin V1a receptor [Folsomia candida]